MPTTRTALVILVFALPAMGACGAFLGLSGDDDDDPVPTGNPDAALDGTDVTDASGTNDAPITDGGSEDADAAPTERYVFVTSMPYSGDLGGLFGADVKCNQLANLGDGRLKGRAFVAYLSTSGGTTISAAVRLNPNGPPFKRLDGTVVAASKDVFVDGPINAAINVDDKGTGNVAAEVWTGTMLGGAPSGADCLGWTAKDAGSGTIGSTAMNATANGLWVNASLLVCFEARRLYCVEP